MAGCAPEHTTAVGFMQFEPDPGYGWIQVSAFGKEARWTQGDTHPAFANIVSSLDEGYWEPRPGYQWVSVGWDATVDVAPRAISASLGTRWSPGLRHEHYDHISAGMQTDQWMPDKGYYFPNAGDLTVAWQAGVADKDRAHYLASNVEGQWVIEAGYSEHPGFRGGTYAKWTEGLPHPGEPCLVSSSTEGSWSPISGYSLHETPDGRLQIVGDESPADWIDMVASALGYGDEQLTRGAGGACANRMLNDTWRIN